MEDEDYSRRGFLTTAGSTTLAALAGCAESTKEPSTNEIYNLKGNQDHINVNRDGLVFRAEGGLYGFAIINIEGENAQIEVGSYDVDNYDVGWGYQPDNTREMTIENGATIRSEDIDGIDNMPDIRVGDVDPGNIAVELPYEVDYGELDTSN